MWTFPQNLLIPIFFSLSLSARYRHPDPFDITEGGARNGIASRWKICRWRITMESLERAAGIVGRYIGRVLKDVNKGDNSFGVSGIFPRWKSRKITGNWSEQESGPRETPLSRRNIPLFNLRNIYRWIARPLPTYEKSLSDTRVQCIYYEGAWIDGSKIDVLLYRVLSRANIGCSKFILVFHAFFSKHIKMSRNIQ